MAAVPQKGICQVPYPPRFREAQPQVMILRSFILRAVTACRLRGMRAEHCRGMGKRGRFRAELPKSGVFCRIILSADRRSRLIDDRCGAAKQNQKLSAAKAARWASRRVGKRHVIGIHPRYQPRPRHRNSDVQPLHKASARKFHQADAVVFGRERRNDPACRIL